MLHKAAQVFYINLKASMVLASILMTSWGGLIAVVSSAKEADALIKPVNSSTSCMVYMSHLTLSLTDAVAMRLLPSLYSC